MAWGEGKCSIFARNGYDVTAFDTANSRLEKAKQLADQMQVELDAINSARIDAVFIAFFV